MEISEKKEIIFSKYSKIFDRVAAYRAGDLTKEETEILNKDEDFQNRLNFLLDNETESVLANLKTLGFSVDQGIALRANLEYGKIINPEVFSKDQKEIKNQGPNTNPPVTILQVMRQNEYTAEVLRILAQCGVFAAETENITTAKIN